MDFIYWAAALFGVVISKLNCHCGNVILVVLIPKWKSIWYEFLFHNGKNRREKNRKKLSELYFSILLLFVDDFLLISIVDSFCWRLQWKKEMYNKKINYEKQIRIDPASKMNGTKPRTNKHWTFKVFSNSAKCLPIFIDEYKRISTRRTLTHLCSCNVLHKNRGKKWANRKFSLLHPLYTYMHLKKASITCCGIGGGCKQ